MEPDRETKAQAPAAERATAYVSPLDIYREAVTRRDVKRKIAAALHLVPDALDRLLDDADVDELRLPDAPGVPTSAGASANQVGEILRRLDAIESRLERLEQPAATVTPLRPSRAAAPKRRRAPDGDDMDINQDT